MAGSDEAPEKKSIPMEEWTIAPISDSAEWIKGYAGSEDDEDEEDDDTAPGAASAEGGGPEGNADADDTR